MAMAPHCRTDSIDGGVPQVGLQEVGRDIRDLSENV
jgi:hypothetical protein